MTTASRCSVASRVEVLRNAVRVAESSDHAALPTMYQVSSLPPDRCCSTNGLTDGQECSHACSEPARRGRDLACQVYDLHVELVGCGWIANDFYDGSMIYDFERGEFHAVDLDTYHRGPFINRVGRMFGSKRFMAPEEFRLGAEIDERTTVFNMGRAAAVLLSDNSLDREAFSGSDAMYEVMLRACRDARGERFQSMSDLYSAWLEADTSKLGGNS